MFMYACLDHDYEYEEMGEEKKDEMERDEAKAVTVAGTRQKH
jgi:hypothetical protein